MIKNLISIKNKVKSYKQKRRIFILPYQNDQMRRSKYSLIAQPSQEIKAFNTRTDFFYNFLKCLKIKRKTNYLEFHKKYILVNLLTHIE